jgi:hypothetical protein
VGGGCWGKTLSNIKKVIVYRARGESCLASCLQFILLIGRPAFRASARDSLSYLKYELFVFHLLAQPAGQVVSPWLWARVWPLWRHQTWCISHGDALRRFCRHLCSTSWVSRRCDAWCSVTHSSLVGTFWHFVEIWSFCTVLGDIGKRFYRNVGAIGGVLEKITNTFFSNVTLCSLVDT